MNAQEFLALVDKSGCKKLRAGVWISTSESMIQDQISWDDEDESKDVDLTSASYWMTTNDGFLDSVDIDDIKEMIKERNKERNN